MGKPEICAAFIYEDGKNKLQIPPENYKRKRITRDEEFLEIPLLDDRTKSLRNGEER